MELLFDSSCHLWFSFSVCPVSIFLISYVCPIPCAMLFFNFVSVFSLSCSGTGRVCNLLITELVFLFCDVDNNNTIL